MTAAATIWSHVTALNLGSCLYVELNDTLMPLLMIRATFFSIAPLCTGAAECLDVKSSAALSLPGRCFIWNLYIKESSLSLKVFGSLSSRALSEKIFIRDLWSTVTNSSGYPSTNNQRASSLYTNANASSSMGAYHDSALLVNWELTRLVLFWWHSSRIGSILPLFY